MAPRGSIYCDQPIWGGLTQTELRPSLISCYTPTQRNRIRLTN